MKILIVDDHVLFRDGLTVLLECHPEFSVVGLAETVVQCLQLIPQLKPDAVLMDIDLPDGNGLEAAQKIISVWPEIKVVVLSSQDSDEYALSAYRHGAAGFIAKNTPKEHFLSAMKAVQQGEIAITRKLTRRLIEEYIRMCKIQKQATEGVMEALTYRELEVFHLLGMGASNREIGENLHITENTVKSHVHNILDKLKLRSRLEARNIANKLAQVNGAARHYDEM